MGWQGAVLFPHFISWAKVQGYDPDEGLDDDDLDPAVLSRALFGIPEDVTVSAVTDWKLVGLLFADGGRYFIKDYRKWQPDPTVTERVRRHRQRAKRSETVTSVCNADLTGRDSTGLDGTTPLCSPIVEGEREKTKMTEAEFTEKTRGMSDKAREETRGSVEIVNEPTNEKRGTES